MTLTIDMNSLIHIINIVNLPFSLSLIPAFFSFYFGSPHLSASFATHHALPTSIPHHHPSPTRLSAPPGQGEDRVINCPSKLLPNREAEIVTRPQPGVSRALFIPSEFFFHITLQAKGCSLRRPFMPLCHCGVRAGSAGPRHPP